MINLILKFCMALLAVLYWKHNTEYNNNFNIAANAKSTFLSFTLLIRLKSSRRSVLFLTIAKYHIPFEN